MQQDNQGLLTRQSPILSGWVFSYVAFRLIHTIRDRQTGRLPDVNLREYLIYILFFPAFTAGPIDRIDRFIKDLREPFIQSSSDWIVAGERIMMGLFKKFIVADLLSIISINNQNVSQVNSTPWLWIMVYAYAFQIYFDFSGYTDIAIGIGNILGFHLPENFNKPYLQRNITQFWNNWHITLTQWFRAYFFFPFTRKIAEITTAKVFSRYCDFNYTNQHDGVDWHVAWGYDEFLPLGSMAGYGFIHSQPVVRTNKKTGYTV